MRTPLSQEKSNDPARQVKIHFDLTYVECDLAEERFENHPVVEMFLSGHFIRSAATGGMLSIPLDEHRLDKVYSGTLCGSLNRKYNKGIPIKAAIGIKSFAQHRDAHGNPAYVNVGTTHAYMGDILSEKEYDHHLDLLMRTTVVGIGEQLKKGVVELHIRKIDVGPSVDGLDHTASSLQAPAQDIEQELSAYISSTLQIESQLPDVMEGMKRIRAPMDISQVGVESTGNAFLPIAAFAMDEVPESNPDFFRNALSTVLGRKNLTREHVKNMPPHEKARTMGLLICYGVQSFGYIGDSVEKTNRHNQFIQRLTAGTEEFANIWTSTFGDCEDSAKGIHSTLKAFVNAKFDYTKDQDLIELQQIADNYTPVLTLAVVHGQKVGDHEGVGAHMYLPLLPNYQIKEGFSRTESGRRLLERMRPAERSHFMSENASRSTAKNRAKLIRDQPPLFCEGTGHIDPLGYKDPILDKRKYVATEMPAFTWAKQQIPHEEQGPSSFYFIDVSGITSKFVDQGINMGGIIFGTVNENYDPADPDNAHEMVRGLLYTDRLKDSEKMALMPQPFIPPRVMSIIREANMLNPPPRPLVLDLKGDMGPERNEMLDTLQQHVESLGRDANGAGDPVNLYMLPSQLEPHNIQEMIQCATTSEKLVALKYTKEQVTNSIYHYRVGLYIK
jgi:hypothetical protein